MTRADQIVYMIQGMGPAYEVANGGPKRYCKMMAYWFQLTEQGIEQAIKDLDPAACADEFLDWVYQVPRDKPTPQPRWLQAFLEGRKIHEARERTYHQFVPPEGPPEPTAEEDLPVETKPEKVN